MSKHLGNILEPIPLMDRHGADALRWFMLCSGSPWSSRRVGHKVLDEIASKVHPDVLVDRVVPVAVRAGERLDAGPTAVGERTHARPVGAVGGRTGSRPRSTTRWRTSTPPGPARRSPSYIDDLSNWYVRRSRRRFWDGDPAALATLHECLRRADPAAGAVHPVRHRAGVGGAVRADRAASTRCTSRPGRQADAALVDAELSSRSRWCAGWSSSAGRPGPTRR